MSTTLARGRMLKHMSPVRTINGIARRIGNIFPQRNQVRIQSGVVPAKPIPIRNIPLLGNWCTMYARQVARKMGIYYKKAPSAWEFAGANKSVWVSSVRRTRSYVPLLKPGQIAGIYVPTSPRNQVGRYYTHVALYVGERGGEHYFMHRVGRKNYLESLSTLLNKRGWKIRELIEPKGGL